MNDSSVVIEAPKKSTDFGSFFVSTNKVVFTNYGPSRLLVFDQVNAYIIAVEKGSEPIYTCLSVVTFDRLPEEDNEINRIIVNNDYTRAALVGRRNVYAFEIPNPRGHSGISRIAGINNKRPITKLLTIGPFPSAHNVIKAVWMPTSAIRSNQKFGDMIGILYSDSILRIYDVKFAQTEVIVNFRSAIVNSMKEDYPEDDDARFSNATGLGFSKTIVSFDFGLLFDETTVFFTVYAIDNDCEMYYAAVALLNRKLESFPVVGPVCFLKNPNPVGEPLDLAFIDHEDSDSVSLLAVAFDDGAITHFGGFLYLDWNMIIKARECMRFFNLDTLIIGSSLSNVQLLTDRSCLGEYLVCDSNAIFAVSIQPWLPKLSACIISGEMFNVGNNATIVCHCFQLLSGSGNFRSAAILADTALTTRKSPLDRYLLAFDTEGQLHGRFVPRLYKPFSTDATSIIPKSLNNEATEPPLIATTNIATSVPKLKQANLDELECLNVFTKYFASLENQVSANIVLIKDAINKCNSLKTTHTDQTTAQKTGLTRVVDVVEGLEKLQPTVDRCLPAVEDLSNRMDRVYTAIPREQLTQTHLDNENRLYKIQSGIQEASVNTRAAAVDTVMLRSDYVRRQPSFAPSVSGTRFMLTKATLDASGLKTEVDKLKSKVNDLSIIADNIQRTSRT